MGSPSGVQYGAELRYRRSPCLVCGWLSNPDGQLFFENYAVGTRITAAPETLLILDALADWESLDSLHQRLPEYSRESLATALHQLVDCSLLQRSDQTPHPLEEAMYAAAPNWSSWSPEAAYFHFSTKDAPFDEQQTVREYLAEISAVSPRPPSVKHIETTTSVPLPDPVPGCISNILKDRRTWRRFSPKPVSLADLATTLQLTFGVQGWVDLPIEGKLPLKTSPSGGARHSIEAYVVAVGVDSLPSGIYHYAPDEHRLELVESNGNIAPDKNTIQRFLPAQPWFWDAPVVLVMTSVFERVQWKYRFSRAYRAVLLDAGHLSQTFCLVATSLGLAPFCTMALADSEIERTLGVNGVDEGAIFLVGVGHHP